MIIGQSPEIKKLKKFIIKIAKNNESALIIGEPGTGKKLTVSEIHKRSTKKNKPLIFLNCSAIGDNITESDLYGVKQSNKDYTKRKIGVLEQANDGILCLENIDELLPKFQKIFFNIFSEKKYKNPETGQIHAADFQIFALTSDMNIKSNNTIRSDLLSLIDNFTIFIPSLRKRKQDILLLFNFFLENKCKDLKKDLPETDETIFESLIEYNWPENILELRKTVYNLVQMSENNILDSQYLPFVVKKHPLNFMKDHGLPQALAQVEKYLISLTLKRFAGNQTKAAESLNISEATLRYKMKKFGFSRKSF